jgi:hypothetical protein
MFLCDWHTTPSAAADLPTPRATGDAKPTTSFFTRSRLNMPSGRQLMWTKRQITSEEKAETHTEIWHGRQQWLSKTDALWGLRDYKQWMLQILATALPMLTIQCRYRLRRSKTDTCNVSSARLPLVLLFLTFFSKCHIFRRIRRYKW